MSSTVYEAKGSNVVGGYQPIPTSPMDVKEAPSDAISPRAGSKRGGKRAHEWKGCYCHCELNAQEVDRDQRECEEHGEQHNGCHRRRLRRAAHFSFASVVVLALVLFMTFKCRLDRVFFGSPEALTGSGVGLEKRQSTGTGGSTNGNGTQSSFVKNKLYLIIVFVGLLICVILAIMLAAWCCRGAFENPCCCPCYLCACCGGLACLECISCGLCAEGVDQLL